MRQFLLVLALTMPGSLPVLSQNNPELADSMQWYSCHWNGSIASGTAFSVSIADSAAPAANYYPVGLTIVSTVDTVVHLRNKASTTPTGVTTVTPGKINTNSAPEFQCFGDSNVSSGGLITSYPVKANVPVTIPMDGNKLNKGSGTARNVTLHVDAGAGTAYITWKIGRK